VDSVFLLAVVFVLLASLGLVCGGTAVFFFLRMEQPEEIPNASVAIWVFVLQYGLVFALVSSRTYVLLPTILMLLIVIALVTVMRLGLRARSRAGSRMVLAAVFTLSSYLCGMSAEYLQLRKYLRF
jgi:lipoprotein signal peptidase